MSPRLGPKRFGVAMLVAGLAAAGAAAHPRAPSLLELRETDAATGHFDVLWKTPLQRPAGTLHEPVLPEACRALGAPERRAEATALVTRFAVACGPGGLRGGGVGVSGLEPRGAGAVLRVELADGEVLQQLLTAGSAIVAVPEVPSRLGVLGDYLRLGVGHLVFGIDHVLFVLGLLLLVRGPRALVLTVTAFTLGHSVTLSIAALGHSPVPSRWAEVAIAATLLALAVELVPREGRSFAGFRERPWRMAWAFGLLHGLGFAGALSEIGLPRGEIVTALVAFNLGIELGQLGLVAVALAAARALRGPAQAVPSAWRAHAAAYGLGGLAGYWAIERTVAALAHP